jgi:hypothetical protein
LTDSADRGGAIGNNAAETRLGRSSERGSFRAILAGPATAAGIAAKIEVALAYLPGDFAAELGGEIIMAAKADAERIAEKGEG